MKERWEVERGWQGWGLRAVLGRHGAAPNRDIGGVRAPVARQSPSSLVWERQREGRGALSIYGQSLPQPQRKKEQERTKQARSRRNRQINKAGEEGKPPSHQTQEFLGEGDLQKQQVKVIYA